VGGEGEIDIGTEGAEEELRGRGGGGDGGGVFGEGGGGGGGGGMVRRGWVSG